MVKLGGSQFQVGLGSYPVEPSSTTYSDIAKMAKVAIRPSQFQIKTIPQKKSINKSNTLIAKVIKSTYLGTHMEYSLETAKETLFVTSQNLMAPPKVGDWVELYCDPAAAILVKDEEKDVS